MTPCTALVTVKASATVDAKTSFCLNQKGKGDDHDQGYPGLLKTTTYRRHESRSNSEWVEHPGGGLLHHVS